MEILLSGMVRRLNPKNGECPNNRHEWFAGVYAARIAARIAASSLLLAGGYMNKAISLILFLLKHFHQSCSVHLRARQGNGVFDILAAFGPGHRPLRACSLPQPCQKPKPLAPHRYIISAIADGEELIGTWKSNKEATVAYLRIHTHLTSPQLDLVAQALGKMTFTFDKTNLTTRKDDWKVVRPYKIVSETTNSVTIESKNPNTQRPGQSKFEFDGNSFWNSDDRIPGYKERFDKFVQK